MDDPASLIQCKTCKKPMLQSVAHSHIKLCLQKKNERTQKKKEQKEANRKARELREKLEKAGQDGAAEAEVDDESGNEDKACGSTTGKKSAVKQSTSTSKKRKAEAEADKAPTKKKTKKEIEATKPKVPKPKGPVDVEKQCGVILPNGAMCARSLTCKSHSMGAKRAVPGRSLPYDMLLTAYQKKNQAKQQSKSQSHYYWARLITCAEAAIDANAPLLDDFTDPAGPIDSDEEKDLVMAAIARSRPRPIEQHVFVPIRQRYNYLRVKEMLSNALGGGRGNVFGGSQLTGTGEGTEGEQRRSSLIQPNSARGPGSGGLPAPSRKSSVVGAATSTPITT